MLEFWIETDDVEEGCQLTIRPSNAERRDRRAIGGTLPRAKASHIALWLEKALPGIQRVIIAEELRSLAENYGTD